MILIQDIINFKVYCVFYPYIFIYDWITIVDYTGKHELGKMKFYYFTLPQ